MSKKDKPNQILIEYLEFYFSTEKPQFAILINGKWGSGKTFFIKNQIEKWKTKSSKELKTKITRKPIYISLYGLKKNSDINLKIKEALNPILYSKSAKVIKKIFLGAIKTATHINLDTDGDGESDGKLSVNINPLGILKNDDESIKGEKILIFDDLERCNININDLFGYINEFVEHYNCKVIIISDEKKLEAKCKKDNEPYEEFKEKLIGQTFKIEPEIDQAINTFIKVSSIPKKEISTRFIEISKDVFQASHIDNLRILKQALLNFHRFENQIDKKFKTDNNYDTFIESLLAHYLIVYIEYKSGFKKISKLTRYGNSNDQNVDFTIKSKYDQVLSKYGLENRVSVIDYQSIIEFIRDGKSNILELNEIISSNKFFRKNKISEWEYLWNWSELENEDFEYYFKNIVEKFKSKSYKNVYIIIHIFGILLEIDKHNIKDLDKKKNLKLAKQQIVEILKENKNISFTPISDHSLNKGYSGKDVDEFKELVKYTNDKIQIHNSQNKDDYLKTIFENINDENVSIIEDRLDRAIPEGNTTYKYSPIFENVDGKILAEQLLELKNKNASKFFYFLQRRYYPDKMYASDNLEEYHKKDIRALNEVKMRLSDELKNAESIKAFNIQRHIDFLDKLIKKLEQLNRLEN